MDGVCCCVFVFFFLKAVVCVILSERVAYKAAEGFLSSYLCGPLPCLTVSKYIECAVK